jgi:K+/H+ antiporter YhaU regulatory subunit KhtT
VGNTIAGERVRTETGCTVVAVVGDGGTITEIDPQAFTLETGDEVVIAGTDGATTRFERRVGV